MSLRAVFFDVGETLVDETWAWGSWAEWLEVSHEELMRTLRSVIERREDHRRAFDIVRPGVDLEKESEARRRAGLPHWFRAEDVFPDARPCLDALRDEGYLLGIGGNQPAEHASSLRGLGLPADILATSGELGVDKPSPEFFVRFAAAAGIHPEEAAYVGDRIDNDVLPAKEAGMTAVFLRRGPWAIVHATWPDAAAADIAVDTLEELPGALRELRLRG